MTTISSVDEATSGAPKASRNDSSESRVDRLTRLFTDARRLARFDMVQETLYRRLVALRRRLAVDAGVRAWRVYTDGQLLLLCEVQPRDEEELARVPGMGRVRMGLCGSEVLAVVRATLREAEAATVIS